MSQSSLSPIKPCRLCGRPMILRFHDHITVVLTGTGERRLYHRKCVPFIFRPVEPDDLAA